MNIMKKNSFYEIFFVDGDKMEVDGVIIVVIYDVLIYLLVEKMIELFVG